jgi:formylglycine-generating enzyme required for sulfatase activity
VECIPKFEEPAHQVTIRSFQMDVTLVTQAQYQSVMGANPSKFSDCADCPVERVSWTDAHNYCAKLGKRLPTEAEWEYAARGGTATARYGELDKIAWYTDNAGGKTNPVAQKQPNAYGLFDMLGNVWEWTADWWDGKGYSTSPLDNPKGPSSGSWRILRGGAWDFEARGARASYRGRGHPEDLDGDNGFRCARD